MERLTQAQLAQVVAEIERISQRRETELELEQVNEILQELNLPSDLLPDAIVQLRRREVLARQQRRNRLIVLGVVVVILGAIATITIRQQHHNQALASISAIRSRITLAEDNGSNPAKINPQNTVFYRVTLKDVPLNSRLTLSCDWVDPNNQVVHQSRYQTQQSDRSVWTTYCYNQIGSGAATGTWEVKMFLEGRFLSSQKFVVE